MLEENGSVDLRVSSGPAPFKIVKKAEETGGDLVRFEFTLHPSPDIPHGPSQSTSDLNHRRWLLDTSKEHLHPRQEEYFKVLSGQLQISLRGMEQTLIEGEEITLPPGVPHRHWNATGRPTRIVTEHRPALQSETAFETLYRSAQAGNADEDGFPSVLQLAVIQDACPDHAYTTDLPISFQKGVFKVLAPLGRFLGYRASPSTEDDTPSQ